MSRSYKHSPYSGQANNRDMKRIANHKIRQKLKDPDFILKGNDSRKVTCSWDICDYWHITTPNFERYYAEEVARWKMRLDSGRLSSNDTDEPPTREKVWKEYCRWFRRK